MPADLASLPLRERLQHWLEHLAHILPAQAPIREFVHHNTLHGFQHLPFPQALAAAQQLNGARPYWPESDFQAALAAGRISRADLRAALLEAGIERLDEALLPGVTRGDVLLASLLLPAEVPGVARQAWQRQEFEVITDTALWDCCQRLTASAAGPLPAWTQLAAERCEALFAQVGSAWTVRRLLEHLTGEDVLARVRPVLQHHLAAHLDLGMAAWCNPAQARGFYAAWRESAACDLGWDIDDLPNVRHEIADLPDSPFDVLLAELPRLLPDENSWPGYLNSLALELPGWSGMFLWRDRQAGRMTAETAETPVAMIDYLAVRVLLERLCCADLIQRLSRSALSLTELRSYFLAHPAEFYVRDALRCGEVPEELQHRAARLLQLADWDSRSLAEWQALAEAMAAARPAADDAAARRLLGLLRQLAVPDEVRAAMSPAQAIRLLAEAGRFSPLERGHLWLLAYERHYREEIFLALSSNPGRRRVLPPVSAQVVFCMDDREEGTRRHLEEIAPGVRTYGAAGFFGVAMYWQGLDDPAPVALCPVVVKPAHGVQEVPAAQAFDTAVRHAGRRAWRLQWREHLYQDTRRDPWWGPLLTGLAAVPALCALIALTLTPAGFGQSVRRWREQFEGKVATRLTLDAAADAAPATPAQPRSGFAPEEQVDRVEAFLRSIGLTEAFAPLVLLLGHGSGSQNNPHLSAYDCGACSGRHGGPNARVFAAMANRPEVRARLAERGLPIPATCWFVAAEHNTCDDTIQWYDLEAVPPSWQGALDVLLGQLAEACRAHAVERCRRLASAPLGMSPWQGFEHVRGRLHDISQARPELGHANNAVALIGRRSMSQGLFLDRRAFLVSYDPAADAQGKILTNILLAVGPVGAGINLEYYFSTVDNQRFGCGSKITHNLTGLFGVMEGADSDLRTGLPWQMVEIHEPMRLLVVVEQSTAVLTRLLGEQPALQELINNAWIILAAQHPSTAAIEHYCPRRGWLPWAGTGVLPQVARSQDWFAGQRGALSPAILLGSVN